MSCSVGVLSLQGAYSRHVAMLASLGACPVEIRNPEDLRGIDGLIIPGGESTVMSQMLDRWGFFHPLRQLMGDGLPVFGTCAGLILLAETLTGNESLSRLGGLAVTVSRNAYGRQVDSFEAPLDLAIPSCTGDEPFIGVFIRAPRIVPGTEGNEVRVLSLYNGDPVFVRQGSLLGSTFHPELTGDSRIHAWFLSEFCKFPS